MSIRILFKFLFIECGMASNAPTMARIVSVFTPHILSISAFCPLLWLSGVWFRLCKNTLISSHHLSALCLSMISDLLSDTVLFVCGFVDHTVHGFTVLIKLGMWYTIHWVIHPIHIHDWYSDEDIDNFYCAFLSIHVLPISDNRRLNGR